MTRWENVRAIMLNPGDVTPVGVIDGIGRHGDIRRVALVIGHETFNRGYDDIVSREVSA